MILLKVHAYCKNIKITEKYKEQSEKHVKPHPLGVTTWVFAVWPFIHFSMHHSHLAHGGSYYICCFLLSTPLCVNFFSLPLILPSPIPGTQ